MLEVRDLRNIEKAALCLDPGLNVLEGRNAQGKTSILEAVAFLSRGRSFRTDEAALAIRRGAPGLAVRGDAEAGGSSWSQRMELCGTRRVFELDGREVGPGEYGERLEAVVYSNDRIRALQSSSRERRAYIDRGGARLWPGYRQALREYDKTLAHRNAALKQDARDLPAWNDQLALAGGALRHRRGEYAARLCAALRDSEPLTGELVTLAVGSEAPVGSAAAESERLRAQVAAALPVERRAARTLCGPHRDPVALQLDGHDIAAVSSGQARTAMLALLLATLDVFRAEQGRAPVALLDDLDSELDDERTRAVCRAVVRRAQTLVTTAHPGWARTLGSLGRRFVVEAGCVAAAS